MVFPHFREAAWKLEDWICTMNSRREDSARYFGVEDIPKKESLAIWPDFEQLEKKIQFYFFQKVMG